MNTTAGWYHAEGDPPGTTRYWDGEVWQGEPVAQSPTMSGPGPGRVEELSPFGYFKKCITSSYADFSGRARRAEYGWFTLIGGIAQIVAMIPLIVWFVATADPAKPDSVEMSGLGWAWLILVVLVVLALVIPSLAVSVRRLHDRALSGWFLLLAAVLSFIPLLSLIFGLFLLFADSKRGRNDWGPSPKYG